MSDPADIKRLLDAATPGPWHLFTNRHPDRNGNSWGAVEARQHSAGGAGQYPDSTTITWTGPQGRANAALIAAAPNIAAAYIEQAATIARLTAEHDRLREALEICAGSGPKKLNLHEDFLRREAVARAALKEG